MKKIFIWALSIAALFLSASCEDELTPVAVVDDNVAPKPEAIVFTATTENPATKTALSGNDTHGYVVNWQSGDQITVKDNAGNVGRYSTESTIATGSFTYVAESGAQVATAPFKAWYPASIYNGGSPTLPSAQTYVAGNINQAPMYAESGSKSLGFKNLSGIVRLGISTSMSGQKVRSIELSASQGMSGAFTVTNDAAVVSGTAGVTLDCQDGITIGSEPTDFHIAVPANNYTGLKITVWTTEGLTQTRTLKAENTVTVGRSTITKISLSFNDLAERVIDLSSLSDAALTIPTGTRATLTGSKSNCIVTVENGATLTLNAATLNQIVVEKDATIILKGDNRFALVDSHSNYNFIQLGSGGAVTINGTGSLTGSGGGWENIGCIIGNSDVTIAGGTLDLSANDVQAGQHQPSVSVRNLTVTGGSLTARGGNNSHYGENRSNGIYASGDIVIEGGVVNANGAHGMCAAGNITISGGRVTATGSGTENNNSGISAGGLLTISGGEVTAQGSASSPGIGDKGTCGDILISGGTVTATGGTGAAAIGTGNASSSVCGNITIRNTVDWVAVFKGEGATEAVGHGHASSTVGTVTIETGANVHEDYPRTDLSSNGTANCYIVPGKGHYKFLATSKGNGVAANAGINPSTSSIASAELVWASFGTTTAPVEGELIGEISYKDGYVMFSSGNPFREGNALVAIKDSGGNILWSWHLWFTDDTIQEQTYPSGAKMMDRNLGALASSYNSDNTEDYGLMYQWGRKDPFLNTCYTDYYDGYLSGSNWRTASLPAVLGTVETQLGDDSNGANYYLIHSIQYPTRLIARGAGSNEYNDWVSDLSTSQWSALWGDTKTIFDPCPPGWKVPGKDVWGSSFIDSFNASEFVNNGFTVSGIRYPSTATRLAKPYGYTHTPDGVYVKQCNGYGSPERSNTYHVLVWASDGFLLKEFFYFESNQWSSANEPGVYDYSQIGSMKNIYRNRAASVRCVRDE